MFLWPFELFVQCFTLSVFHYEFQDLYLILFVRLHEFTLYRLRSQNEIKNWIMHSDELNIFFSSA